MKIPFVSSLRNILPLLKTQPSSESVITTSSQKSSRDNRQTVSNTLSYRDKNFIKNIVALQQDVHLVFGRESYLFESARLIKNFNPLKVFLFNPRFILPALRLGNTTKRLGNLVRRCPGNEKLKHIYSSALSYYIAYKLMIPGTRLSNKNMGLKVNVQDLGLSKNGNPIEEVSLRDTAGMFRKINDKSSRDKLARCCNELYIKELYEEGIKLFNRSCEILVSMGHPNLLDFYSCVTGHDLPKLGQIAEVLLDKTNDKYWVVMPKFYKKRTGLDIDFANRSDISYVLDGQDVEMEEVERVLTSEKLVLLLKRTFDGLGLEFSSNSREINFNSLDEYWKFVKSIDHNKPQILLDIAERRGKSPRAHLTTLHIPSEIILVLNPQGGIQDYMTALHEGGHANHYAYMDPNLDYVSKRLGSKSSTESYAFLFHSLMTNPHFLKHQIGLSDENAQKLIEKLKLTNLYMLRRYASKMQFELKLFEGDPYKSKDPIEMGRFYTDLLTDNTGYKPYSESFITDVDPGFYVANYLTAWILEAQLEEYLKNNFGTSEQQGNDWYLDLRAGDFLKWLWKQGSISQHELSKAVGYNDATNIEPLLKLVV